MSKKSDKQKAQKWEKDFLEKSIREIVKGNAQEFCLIVKTKKGGVISYASDGARSMVGKIYREWNQ